MPKQTRYAVKQTLKAVIDEIDRAETKLIDVGRLYASNHQDYYERFSQLVAALENLKVVVQQLSDSI